MNKELQEILLACKEMAHFLERYSAGHIKEESNKLKIRIQKYIKDEEEYGEEIKV